MADVQTTNLAEIQNIQTSVSNINTQTLTHFQVLRTDMEADKVNSELQRQKLHDNLVDQSKENTARHQTYLDEMAKLDSKLTEVLFQEEQKMMGSVRGWLAIGHQLQEDHAAFRAIRKEYPETTKWILKHEAVKSWMKSDCPATPNLWINGIPGAGMRLRSYDSTQKLTMCTRKNNPGICHCR